VQSPSPPPPGPENPLSQRLRDLAQIDSADLTAHQHLTAQILLVVQWYLIEVNAPAGFLTMGPDQIVEMAKSRYHMGQIQRKVAEPSGGTISGMGAPGGLTRWP